MRTFDDMLADEMRDEEFRKAYEDIQPEMDVIRAVAAARISLNLTQKELAERSGINQADISKIENGTRNPSLNLLKRLAAAMGMTLRIQFIPKKPYPAVIPNQRLCMRAASPVITRTLRMVSSALCQGWQFT